MECVVERTSGIDALDLGAIDGCLCIRTSPNIRVIKGGIVLAHHHFAVRAWNRLGKSNVRVANVI